MEVYDLFVLKTLQMQHKILKVGLMANVEHQNNNEDLQRDMIIALSKQPYQDSNPNHVILLENVRYQLAFHLPQSTIQILNIQWNLDVQETNDQIMSNREKSDNIFERDISEAIGFTYGKYPDEDIKEAGMLGLICSLYFFERIQKIYASDKIVSRSNNIFMNNLMKMSQDSANGV